MKTASFDSTPAFAHYRDVMSKLIKVPKAEVDAMVTAAKKASPRNGNPHAPGRKRVKVRRRSPR